MDVNLIREEAAALDELRRSRGWQVLTKRLNEIVAEYEVDILEGTNANKNRLDYTFHDLKREQRKTLIALMEKPEEALKLMYQQLQTEQE